jgi:hypothetical protein
MPPTSSNYPTPPDPEDVSPYPEQPPSQPLQYTPRPQQPVNPYPAQQYGPPQPQPAPREGAEYNFILDQQSTQPKMKLSITSGSSKMPKIILGLVGLFVLLVIVVIVKNSLTAGTGINKPDFISLVEDQVELSHLATEGGAQQGADATTLDTAATINASVKGDENRLITYLSTNHVKVSGTLTAKESRATDLELTNAGQSGLYDQTYSTVMQAALSTYETDLQHTYNVTVGKIGKTLLRSEYANAKLLVIQLTSPIG